MSIPQVLTRPPSVHAMMPPGHIGAHPPSFVGPATAVGVPQAIVGRTQPLTDLHSQGSSAGLRNFVDVVDRAIESAPVDA
ncbi:hypothetical protein GUJ93_ZPchr0010g9145 [Zizania palustris]|uniref:Uncharacterized protein n=1 Tax=Zizania palustris TaxID=103762 RepID=A0A8J5W759_ZIZPA|nr:hypothetical protein GUJ93_ZPchr0010g9145 [Zizania palustris]